MTGVLMLSSLIPVVFILTYFSLKLPAKYVYIFVRVLPAGQMTATLSVLYFALVCLIIQPDNADCNIPGGVGVESAPQFL